MSAIDSFMKTAKQQYLGVGEKKTKMLVALINPQTENGDESLLIFQLSKSRSIICCASLLER